MTPKEQAKAARSFAERWQGHGYEKGEAQSFWIDLLTSVFGLQNFVGYIKFEGQVQNKGAKKVNTNYIDGYISETHVLIEHKSSDIDLLKPDSQTGLNAYDQAKKYKESLPYSQIPKWIVTCNFTEFHIYDMEKPNDPPKQIFLKDLEKEYYRLSFLVDETNVHLQKEKDLTFKSGELVGLLYDKLKVQYGDESDENLKHLNKLCVRLVFCLYAEDAGIFGKKSMFGDYLKRFNADSLRDALLNLFRILDQKESERSKYEKPELLEFPYVNGGLFSGATLDEIPQLTEEIKILLVTKASDDFDWSQISPTIFGSLFESTLNMETRRSGGMHYTSIENIHKVIDPLFMNQLNEEFAAAKAINANSKPKVKEKQDALKGLQDKISKLQFLDPACGSGNFLTETYLSLRRLENGILKELSGGTGYLDLGDIVKVKINQFYGIEINDFAVSVAKTALWIAESQMLAETEGVVNQNFDFLPLKSNANIVEGNALRIDWNTVCPAEQLSYIIGNPPFVGARVMKDGSPQKQDMDFVFGSIWKNYGDLDYVAGWYLKCAEIMQVNPSIKSALVSTNSITQGLQVPILWKPLIEKYNISINFAWRTFRWDNGTKDEAHVHCVIIGFSNNGTEKSAKQEKIIFTADGTKIIASNIHPYLIDFQNIFLTNRTKPICNVPEIGIGNKPIDDGNYLFKEKEKDDFIKLEPQSEKWFRKWLGADEFIYKWNRYCLWLGNCPPNELIKMPESLKRVQAVREFRLKSTTAGTRKLAEKPTRFHIENFPDSDYLLIPCHSLGTRDYIPMGFVNKEVLSSNAVLIVPQANNYHLGVLTSVVHMAWMRIVCGRLETRYRYSAGIVYNNFPWPDVSEKQKTKIEKTAQAILDARDKYPDCSFYQFYGENSYLFADLVAAHQANDRAVMEAYGFKEGMSDEAIVGELLKMYEKLTSKQPEAKTKCRKKAK